MTNSASPLHIAVLTGIRSDYDILAPVLRALQEDTFFQLTVVACAAHLSPLHKYSVQMIRQEGFCLEEVESLLYTDTESGRVKSMSLLLMGLGDVFARIKPDIVLVLGDREEALAGAIAASYMRIPVVHIAAGDHTHPVGGNIDEEARHAITKLSHLFLTLAPEHAARVRGLGENPERIFVVGNPALDVLRVDKGISRENLAVSVGATALGDYLVCIHHALNSEKDSAAQEMRCVLQAAVDTKLAVFVGAPNSDPGGVAIADVIREYSQHPKVFFYEHLGRPAFISLLTHARALVGNSSLGIVEAPFLHLAVLNVGQRQKERIHGDNVIFVDAQPQAIAAGLQTALYDTNFLSCCRQGRSPYGDGYSIPRILNILRNLPPRAELLAKCMTY